MRQTPNIGLNLYDGSDDIEVDSRLAFNENFEKLDIEAGKTDEMYDFFSQANTQLNMYGGKTLAFNQLQQNNMSRTADGITYTFTDGEIAISGTATANSYWLAGSQRKFFQAVAGHKYFIRINCNGQYEGIAVSDGKSEVGRWYVIDMPTTTILTDTAIVTATNSAPSYIQFMIANGYTARTGLTFKPIIIDLTAIFGVGNEPTLEQCEAIFTEDYYPYNAGELKSAQANKVIIGEVEKSVPTEVIALDGYGHSAGTVYNSVEWVDGRAYFHKRVDEKVFDGSDDEGWSLTATGTYRIAYRSTNYIETNSALTNITNSAGWAAENSNENSNKDYVSCRTTSYDSKYFYIFAPSSIFPDLNSLKTYLSNNPLSIAYPLATEEVTEITNLFPSNFNLFASAGDTSFEFVDNSIAWVIPYNSENATKIFADRILYDADDSGLSANNVQSAIDELAESVDDISADYIVEQGTDGIWTYRKWNSGIAECWTNTSKTFDGVAGASPLYKGYATIGLPTLFNATPTVTYSCGATNGYDFCGKVNVNPALDTVFLYVVSDGQLTTSTDCKFNIHCIGTYG